MFTDQLLFCSRLTDWTTDVRLSPPQENSYKIPLSLLFLQSSSRAKSKSKRHSQVQKCGGLLLLLLYWVPRSLLLLQYRLAFYSLYSFIIYIQSLLSNYTVASNSILCDYIQSLNSGGFVENL